MSLVMRALLSHQGYDNYLLANEGGAMRRTCARFKHLALATAQTLPMVAVAGGIHYVAKTCMKGPLYGYYPGKPPIDNWRHHKEALVYILPPSLIGAAAIAKFQNWTSLKNHVVGIWDPGSVARRAYRQELKELASFW